MKEGQPQGAERAPTLLRDYRERVTIEVSMCMVRKVFLDKERRIERRISAGRNRVTCGE